MIRKIILSSGSVYYSAVAVSAASPTPPKPPAKQESPVDELAHYKCKPSDLPIYTPLQAYNKTPAPKPHPTAGPAEQALQDAFGAVRVEVTKAYTAVASQKQAIVDFVDTGKAHTQGLVEYLNERDNTVSRIGAVAIGGLAGFIFGLRGGTVRRLFYTSVGAGAIASVCYPKEAKIYAEKSLVEAKKGACIAYNFAFGIKPTDDVNSPNWPKIPTTFSELSDSVSDLAKSAKDALFSSKK